MAVPDTFASRSRTAALRLGAVVVLVATAIGCALVADPASPTAATASTKPMPRTIAIETLFVRFAADETETEEALWSEVDEQVIDAGLRHRLAAHGLRAGIVSSLLPARVRTKLAAASSAEHHGPEPASEQIVARRVLRLLPGKEGRLVARAAVPELVVFESAGDTAGGSGVLGRTFRDATSELVLCGWPAADGRSRITVVPAIEHGPQRRSWTGEDGVFQLEAGQERHAYDSLQIDVELTPDRLLVVGSHGEAGSSVASAVFRGPSTEDRRVVILRPLGRGPDPMFDERGPEGPVTDLWRQSGQALPTGLSATPR